MMLRAFNNVDVDIVHLEKWKEQCSMFVGFNEIDPNDIGRIMLQRSGAKALNWKQCIRKYLWSTRKL